METKPRLMPLLPLRGMLVFPGMIMDIFSVAQQMLMIW